MRQQPLARPPQARTPADPPPQLRDARWRAAWPPWLLDVIAWSGPVCEWCHPVPRWHPRGPVL